MWRAEIDGLRLSFHLAGINNQNFLMRDDQTGTYWQQISGRAISGPLAGRQLTRVPSDELTFALWKSEQPQGTVLDDVAVFRTQYAAKDWDVRMRRAPTVLSYPESGVAARELIVGLRASGASRAFPYDAVLAHRLIQDRVGSELVVLVTGPDGKSVRAFRSHIPGTAAVAEFYRLLQSTATPASSLFMDSATGSQWDFQGCAVSGPSHGICLDRLEALKDYWFDWRNYNPATSFYKEPAQPGPPR